MDANLLEKSIQDTDLNPMYILGRTLKEWAANEGKPCTVTTDGFPIEDKEMYLVTSDGIWVVE